MAVDIPCVLFIRASGWFPLLNNLINHVAMNTCVQVLRGRVRFSRGECPFEARQSHHVGDDV